MVQLWVVAQFVVLALGFAFGSFSSQSQVPAPLQLLFVLLVGAAVLAPLTPWFARRLARWMVPAPWVLLRRTGRSEWPETLIPGAPGTPGAALARAPSAAPSLA